MQKRQSSDVNLDNDDDDDVDQGTKKMRYDELALVEKSSTEISVLTSDKEKRTSSLQAPTMLLTGHEAAVYSICFDPTGSHLASASFDKQILLWDVYGDCKNYNVLSGHKNAVLEVKWASDNSHLLSCSADKTVCTWDPNKGKRTRKLSEHTAVVNSCSLASKSPTIFASGSDDCSVIIWDSRSKKSVLSLYHDYQITSVCMSSDGQFVFSGGIDNNIRRWDLRKADPGAGPDMSLKGHSDTVTGLALSPDDNFLLSNAMDSTLKCWDVRPFVTSDDHRCERQFEGVHHGAEKLLLRCSWSTDREHVACGSADRIVHVWDVNSTKLLYYLPGHKASVNEVIFHPTEPIIASCGSDKQIFLGELSE